MTQTYLRPSGIQPTAQFICAAERDVFKKNHSYGFIKKTLRERAQIHTGPVYTCVSKGPNDQLHTILSTDHGYALGECVLSYLHEHQMAADNVIWCEEVPEQPKASLLVIIVNGVVQYDAYIAADTLDKNATLILEQSAVKFSVMVHGATPITQASVINPGPCDLPLSAELVDLFNTLDTALLPHIKALRRFELVSITKAFDNAQLKSGWALWLWLSLLLVAGYMGSVFLQPKATSVQPSAAVVIDSFSGYKAILKTPSPPAQMAQVHSHLHSLNYLEGVLVQQSKLTQDRLTVHLVPLAGVISHLTRQLQMEGWKTSVEQGKIIISRSLDTPLRPTPTVVMPIRPLLNSLLDSAFVAGINVDVEAIQSNGRYQFTKVTLQYTSHSDLLHEFVGLMLQQVPAVLIAINISHYAINSQHNTLSFIVYGVANV